MKKYIATVVILLSFIGCKTAKKETIFQKPNILFIMTDDHALASGTISGKFIHYKSFDQAKDLVLTILIAFASSLFVSFEDSYLLNYTSLDVVRLIAGGLTGFVTFITLAYLFKLDALSEITQILKKNDTNNKTFSPPN